MNLIKAKRLHLREQNKRFGPHLVEIPRCDWTGDPLHQPVRVWQSKDFCVQQRESNGHTLLCVCRTAINSDGGWKDGITWDELQRLKCEAGYADRWAIECYPPNDLVVNVANFRHLWLLPQPPAFGWHKQS
jgi:hypothetical protein